MGGSLAEPLRAKGLLFVEEGAWCIMGRENEEKMGSKDSREEHSEEGGKTDGDEKERGI